MQCGGQLGMHARASGKKHAVCVHRRLDVRPCRPGEHHVLTGRIQTNLMGECTRLVVFELVYLGLVVTGLADPRGEARDPHKEVHRHLAHAGRSARCHAGGTDKPL